MDFGETLPHARPSLIAAIESGDEKLIECLMEENCPVDVADHRGWRPLHVAASKGHLSIVQRLLQLEDIAIDWRSFEGDTALMVATGNEHLQVCKLLLQNGAKPNIANNKSQSPLHRAVRMWWLDGAKLLLEFGAEVNVVDCDGRTPIFDAARYGRTKIVTLLIEYGAHVDRADGKGTTLLFEVVRSGDIRCIRLIHERLCDNGNSNVDVEAEDGATPLIVAAVCGHLDCVQFLLDKGADANHARKNGYLALHEATKAGHLGCVKALLPRTSQFALLSACYGSRVTEYPDWLPAFWDRVRNNRALYLPQDSVNILHLTVDCERLEILQHLLESGIHPDHFISIRLELDKDFYDDFLPFNEIWAVTALGFACYKGSIEMVTLLLDHDAQFTLGNDEIRDPLQCALIGNCPLYFIRFLVARGAYFTGREGDDDSPAICLAFNQPQVLHELMVLGGRLTNWECKVPGSVGHILEEMAIDPLNGDDLLKVLLVLVHFAPRYQFVPLCARLKSIWDKDPYKSHKSLEGWRHLDQELAAPQSLQQLCRLKTREVLTMRRGFRLEAAISTLQLPKRLGEYLMFR